jgi:hypothetical protein
MINPVQMMNNYSNNHPELFVLASGLHTLFYLNI